MLFTGLSLPRTLYRLGVNPLRRSSTNVVPDELAYIDSLNSDHYDLPSFLKFASRIELDPTSTTYVGTHYEYTVHTSFQRLGFSLKRVGGRSDHGVDLLGIWSPPSASIPLKVIVQCKAYAGKGSGMPAQIRELEGAFVGAPQGWRGSRVLGFLVGTKPATKAAREALGRSRWPMGYVLCTPAGKIMQMLWNRRAEEEGLEGIGVEFKYAGGERTQREVVLTWKGNVFTGSASN